VIKLTQTAAILLLISSALFAQDKAAVGFSGIYNFPLHSIGGGFRIQVPVNHRVSLVPKLKYMPAFNTIHEVYGGLSLQYNIINNTIARGTKNLVVPGRPVVYVSAGVDYNKWLNYEATLNSKSKAQNLIPEAGIGVSAGLNFVRVFAEVKYNMLWQESYGEIGFLLFPFNAPSPRKNNCPFRL
jgi:hypothetical protein